MNVTTARAPAHALARQQFLAAPTIGGRGGVVASPWGPVSQTGTLAIDSGPMAGAGGPRLSVPGMPRQGRLEGKRRSRVLLGRDRETEEISSLLRRAREGGAALVVRGEAGIGKTALLAEGGRTAAEQGMLVLRTAGVRCEAGLPFAGLHQLLRPILAKSDDLLPSRSPALRAALGMAGAGAPEVYPVALAVLDLLSEAAARAPVVVLVEDAQWLDAPAAEVLAFVARRVEADPIVVLAAIREGYESPLLEAGLPGLCLTGLAERSARELLDARFPDLAPGVRERLLGEARGNPLALLELPAALGAAARSGQADLPARLPLTADMECAFASRAGELPGATQALLRIAAADDGGLLREIMQAAGVADGMQPTFQDVVPAIRAQLIDVDGQRIRFRHPLLQSAIYQAASIAERHTAHLALAKVLAHHPRRRARHQAAAAAGDPALSAGPGQAARVSPGQELVEPLTGGEVRVLRYLPTNLTASEIARQMCLSVHTITTHMRHIYAKLGAHRRHEAVDQARALGLLAPFQHAG